MRGLSLLGVTVEDKGQDVHKENVLTKSLEVLQQCYSSLHSSCNHDHIMRLLLRWSYSTCPRPARALRLKALPGELGCEQGKPGRLETTFIPGKEGAILKKSTFASLLFLFMGGGLEFVLFTFFLYLCPKIRSFFFH